MTAHDGRRIATLQRPGDADVHQRRNDGAQTTQQHRHGGIQWRIGSHQAKQHGKQRQSELDADYAFGVWINHV